MGFVENVNIKSQDSPSIDAFSRYRTSGTGQRLDIEFIYNKQNDLVDEVTTGTGTVTHNANSRDLTLSIGSTINGDQAAMYSYDVPYTPGNSQLIAITGTLDLANIGGGTVELFVRSKVSGTVSETTFAQSTWTNATSGINWNFSQIFMIDFQSLKVGRIRFYLDQNGIIVPLKEVCNDNVRSGGYWQLPSLPVYWRIYNDETNTYMEMGYGDEDNGIGIRYALSVNASATMCAICATVKSEGGNDLKDLPRFNRSIDNYVTAVTVGATEIPIISIRPRSTFNSIPNRGLAFPISLDLEGDNPIRYGLYHDATLTSPSWTNVDNDDSMMEYDISASAFTNGHLVYSGYLGTNKNTSITLTNILGKTLLWNRRNTVTGILTLTGIRTTATNSSVKSALRWGELR